MADRRPEPSKTLSRRKTPVAPRRVTVVDVAREAGVSPMTVSNVVNGHHRLMSEATRRLVEAAIERLGYRPHVTGRSLRLDRRFAIGIVLVDPSPTFLADPFITQLVAGLSNYLGEQGYGLVVQGIAPDRLADAPLIQRHETDGLCLLLSGPAPRRHAMLDLFGSLHQPLVLFQEPVPERIGDAISIRQDDHGGACALARRLLGQGVRNILLLKPELDWPAIDERERGVRTAIAGQRARVRFVAQGCGVGDFVAVQTALAAHVDANGIPGAVMGGNDQIGIAALKWLRGRGLAVPQDVRITGFNAFDAWRYSDPVLTTVVSPAYEMGRRGGEALLSRLQGKSFAEGGILLPVALQPGESA
jgi:LacI family transcriptional regulator